MTESTSIESYRTAIESGLISAKQQAVISFLADRDYSVTQGQINRYFNDTNRSYAPRFKELEDAGVIKCVEIVLDTLTNRNVKAYRLTGFVPTQQVKRKQTLTGKDIEHLVRAIRTAAAGIWRDDDNNRCGLYGGITAVYELETAMVILKRKGLA
jgi:hypothetical protein